MPRYRLEFAYNGGPFFGWQAQDGLRTVQGDLQQALTWVLREQVTLMAAGRTDRGVHAEGQVAHFDAAKEIESPDFLVRRINSIVFPNIAVKAFDRAEDDFHARFSALARQYRYEFTTRANPLRHETLPVYFASYEKDVLQHLAGQLVGVHDLSGFSKESEQHTHSVCEVMTAEWHFPSSDHFVFRVKANRFLHHTVRGMTGTMLAIAGGKKPESDFMKILKEGRRDLCGPTALAKGLVLEKIFY